MKISIRKSSAVFILTGAGVSKESGLSTFRENEGLWENHRIEDVATPEGFLRDSNLVWKFYSQRRDQLLKANPNKAHLAIAEFQNRHENTYLITQNVDNLHEKAGSSRVIHMHGTLSKIRCTKCTHFRDDLEHIENVPICAKCGSLMRPDVVWFGEMPYEMNLIYNILPKTELFIAIGTSGVIYPAAGFVSMAKAVKAMRVLINLEEGENEDFDEFIQGKAGEVVKEFLQGIYIE